MYETGISYVGVPEGRTLLEVILHCDRATTGRSYQVPSQVLMEIMTLEDIVRGKSSEDLFELSMDQLVRLVGMEELHKYLSQTCIRVINYFSDLVIKEFQREIVASCVTAFLKKTPIGGREKRRFDARPIIDFGATDPAVRYLLRSKVRFTKKGFIRIASESDDDCDIAADIMAMYTKHQVDEKMRMIEIEEESAKHVAAIREIADLVVEAQDKVLSQSGRVCKDKCRLSGGRCICTVDSYRYMGIYYDWDYCNPSECES